MCTPTTAALMPSSLFATATNVFEALTCEPDPLGLDCAVFDADLGLPPRFMPLPEVAAWLDAHPHHRAARSALWQVLAAGARDGSPGWRVAAVVMAMPALTRAAQALSPRLGDDTAQARVLTKLRRALESGVGVDADWLRR